MAERQLVPIPETCTRLGGISRTTVYALVDSGDLVKVNIGTRSFITADSLTRYVESLSRPPEAAVRD